MNRLFFTCLLVLHAGCSLYIDVEDECTTDNDCEDNLSCIEGLCAIARCTRTADCAVGKICRNATACEPLRTTDLLQAPCDRIYGVTPEEALESHVVLLGTIFPKTGDLGDYGPGMDEGVELAVSEINNVGGILGRHIGVLSCDSGTNVDTAVAAGKRLFEEIRVPAIVGPGASGITIEVFNQVIRSAGGLAISPSATSPAITGLDDDNLLWRTAPSDAIQGAAIVRYLETLPSGTKIALINRTDAYGDGLRDTIVAGLCLPTGSFPCDDSGRYFSRAYADDTLETDFSTILQGAGTNLVSFAPDVTVLIAFGTDGKKFLKQAEDQGLQRFIATDGMRTETLVLPNTDKGDPVLGNELLCRLMGTSPASTGGPALAQFETRFNSKYATTAPGVFSATSYDAAYLLFFAIAAAGTDDLTGASISAGLQRLSAGDATPPGAAAFTKATQYLSSSPQNTIDYEGASGALNFDPATGEAPSSIGAWALKPGTTTDTIVDLGVILTATGTYTAPTIVGEVPGTSVACEAYRQ